MEGELGSVCDKQSSLLVVQLNFIHIVNINKLFERWKNDYMSYKNIDVLKWPLYYASKVPLSSGVFPL